MKIFIKILFITILGSYFSNQEKTSQKTVSQKFEIKLDTLNLFDSSRNRIIPIAIYKPKTKNKIVNQKIIVFAHGYAENRLGANQAYSYLTENLASKGYFVISIQHELPTDVLIPKTGNIKQTRLPFWERGCQNILFVIGQLKKTNPKLDFEHLNLIGHSNGGDISVLFTHKYPNLVDKIISLDNRRMDIPRTNKPKIYSLRSSDQIADENVLPTIEEQNKFGITIIKLKNTIHIDMNDNGTKKQKNEINKYIITFLNN